MQIVAKPGVSLSNVVSRRAADQLRAFRVAVDASLPDRVEDVVLFGSRARQSARGDSDYDVAVLFGGGELPRRLGHVLSDLAYPHVRRGVAIRPIALAASSVVPDSPIAIGRSIARDGISIA